jgi:hypothetical protein
MPPFTVAHFIEVLRDIGINARRLFPLGAAPTFEVERRLICTTLAKEGKAPESGERHALKCDLR